MIFSVLLSLFTSTHVMAFPEMVRHHYVNCNACHVSPSGGGALTEYGRMISGELLSTWNKGNEALFLHGLPNPEKWPKSIIMGGDIRAVQVHREDSRLREGRFIVMQTSLEAGLNFGAFTAMASFGEPDRDRHIQPNFTRYYLMANPIETIHFRVGRFIPAFGLNVAQHTVPTRNALGFGNGTERNTLEAQWSGEQWHGAFSASESIQKSRVADRERATSIQLEKFFLDSYRVGASFWNGESDKMQRWLASAHGIFGFSESIYALGEFTWQNKKDKQVPAGRVSGLYHFGRFGYEVAKGLHLLGLEEFSKSNLDKANTMFVSVGPGVLWYPRPHFEFELQFTKRKNMAVRNEWENYAYLMMHYYL